MTRVTADFLSAAPLFDESSLSDMNLSVRDLVLELARGKARSLVNLYPDSSIVACDTLVEKDGERLGKPGTPERARDMLSRLQGAAHRVYTGWVVLKGGVELSGIEEAEVYIESMTSDRIEAYIATGSPLDKAGGYGIQDVDHIRSRLLSGDWDTVVGFPVECVRTVLVKLGVIG